MYIRRYIRMLLSLCLLTGCSFRTLHETLHVVGEADSLWQQGQMYDDSTQLARTYSALHAWRAFYADEYAHACYHYGKLLRAKENPVEAMQVFIAATHSRTHDYHILGRVYSNMGSICHLADEFQLSYDMYEKSAKCFLADNDSLSYYFLLNDMAFELAEQGKKDSCYSLISKVKIHEAGDSILTAYNYVSQARACLKVKQYDSVIYYAHLSQKYLFPLSSSALLLAQGYSYIGRKDSATHYANIVIKSTHSLYEINNALYILTNDDNSKNNSAIRETAASRSDAQKLLEIYQGKLSQAVQLLDQDLHRKPDYRWLYTIIGVILFAGSCAILYYLWHKRKVHSRLIHDIDIKQEQKTQLESSIVAMHSEISQLSEQQQKTHQQLLSNIETTCSTLRNSKDILSELNWKDYLQMCKIVNHHFNKLATTLQKMNLSEQEVRLCILVVIGGFLDKQMADILYYSHKSIRSTKRHIALKLGTTSANMRAFLMEKIIE